MAQLGCRLWQESECIFASFTADVST